MAVTEQDIIDNAALFASIINGASDVNIGSLDQVSTMADSDPFHIQVSGVDKKMAKSDVKLLIAGKNNYDAVVSPAVSDDSDDGYSVGSEWVNTADNTSWKCVDSTVGAAIWSQTNSSGGAAPDFISYFPAGSFDYPNTNPAPFEFDTLTNGKIGRHLFDDTTEEQIEGLFTVPDDASGTITFKIDGYAITAAASKNVEFTFYHSAKVSGESVDAAYSSKVSGDLVPNSTQDNLDQFSFTETLANLGWTAGDQVRIKLGRTAPSVDNLSGDYGLTSFSINIPRT